MRLVTALMNGRDLHQYRSSAYEDARKDVPHQNALSTGWPEGYSAPSSTEGALVPRCNHSEQASVAISFSDRQVSWTHTA